MQVLERLQSAAHIPAEQESRPHMAHPFLLSRASHSSSATPSSGRSSLQQPSPPADTLRADARGAPVRLSCACQVDLWGNAGQHDHLKVWGRHTQCAW